ncbi:PREDICTED: trichohyalin isoform X2 [Drosophila arizonae]|uniref:Trichohyalin isoform X2 n=1 Tax=Drosophila arizonae TaxID=7263 RepID=A0ABM1P427_DROAR|nr:PREDICTED: trichohyalin isoform X2 [Drosophila arizonae]
MAADDALTGIGELLFSLLIGYLGALEFAFVARHLYHWSCQHPNGNSASIDAAPDGEELSRLQERLDRELAEAAAKEAAAGTRVMQDGVLYSNGFRVESEAEKRAALAAELERQRRIEEETRKQLAEAEHRLQEDRKRAEEERLAAEANESARRLIEAEKEREAAERKREEQEQRERESEREREENERKVIEAEKQREENESKLLAAENEKISQEAERERQENERKLQEIEREREENERKLLQAELEREKEQRRADYEQQELEENERKLREAEEERLGAQRLIEEEAAAAEIERQLFDLEDEQEQRDAEIVERLLAAERERKLSATESELEEEAILLEESRRKAAGKMDKEKKQRSIEENARLFMEAEEEMVMLQQRMLQAAQQQEDAQYAGMEPVVEEPCVKKILPPRFEEPPVEEPMVVQRVKTQFGQKSGGVDEPYTRSKTLMFPGVSDEGSSVEPNSSQQSSFSTQPSEERRTEEERQEPEGEDNVPDVQYSEDYLRSLDGIKSRSLIREDGSGRRRAFKKRRSSGSSNSSRESRASRDDELKMFTSLEEEELRHGDKADYNPIKYTEPTLRVKSHHRRHKRSPVKDVKAGSDVTGSLEMLGEEGTNPWGEVQPEHYKDTEFWKREKALSIDEEELDLERRASGEEVLDDSQNLPKASSFEHATEEQNELAANSLRQQRSKEQVEQEKDSAESSKATETSSSDIKSNLQTSSATEEQPRRGSPGLRRSPRIDEMDHYEERWRESEAASQAPSMPTPTITIHQPDTGPWRDEYGLLMEGISDFYDFQASVNPSRSRSVSRNPSPQPKNVANRMDVDEAHTLEVYDDSEAGLLAGELSCELVLQMLEANINVSQSQGEQLQLQNVADEVPQNGGGSAAVPMIFETQPQTVNELEQQMQQKALNTQGEITLERETNGLGEPHSTHTESDSNLPQPVIEINDMAEPRVDDSEPLPTREEMRLFVENLRAERNSRERSQSRSRSRSRSRSPLPTPDNIERSLETRRLKRIKQNDELFEQLKDEQAACLDIPVPTIPVIALSPPPLPTISIESVEEPKEELEEPEDTPESMAKLFEQLRLNRVRSHSRSRSPLPSAANLEHSLQHRKEKLIAQNDAFFEQLDQRAKTPEPEFHHPIEERPGSSRDMRSLSPSRSRSNSPSGETEELEFHLTLNVEGADQRTLRQHSAEMENMLASIAKQREFDLEALHQLTNASEEVELRVEPDSPCDYERTISDAARELKEELNISGFKRSTYVGESLDLGSEYSQQREDNARFERSRTPSPSLDLSMARDQAAAQREMQEAILNSLVSASGLENERRLGAKPKTNEYDRRASEERKEDALGAGISGQLDDLRHRTAEFQRSRSQSRSPVRDVEEARALQNIDAEAAKRELQDQLLDQLAASSVNFQNFSRYLNADFLDSERRASDSAIMQLDPFADLEPEEYHHFRRYSLAQEQPVEEYPSDECVYISQIEVRSLTGKRTWLKEDFYTRDLDSLELNLQEGRQLLGESGKESEYATEEGSWARAVLAAEAEAAEFDETSAIYNFDICGEYPGNDEACSSNDSEDERQTVVEMDDDDEDEYEFELDEGISDNNERTQPTDESHHDTSECEEAERNADRYANREANDWEEVDNVEDFADFSLDDGAVGGAYSDPDSFIEQIYNDAVKNRKQSGILRDYETMVQEQLPADNADQIESDKEKSSSESDRYALWAKTRELTRSEEGNRHRDIDVSIGLLEGERRDSEMRYLGDAQVAARQSTRLRTRYGYSPKLQGGILEDDIEVDLNYKPKREYNWRKNFKLDDNESEDPNVEQSGKEEKELQEQEQLEEGEQEQTLNEEQLEMQLELEQDLYEPAPSGELDLRRYSLGGESITLFSRSPERELLSVVLEETLPDQENEIREEAIDHTEAINAANEEALEKPKKKKSKKKTRKGSKTEEELRDENDSDTNQQMNRRGSATREDGDTLTETPKRKVRSRRSSKSSATNEEANAGLFSPRSSIGFVAEETLGGIAELEPAQKKKTKKRKKSIKESTEQESSVAPDLSNGPDIDAALAEALAKIAPITVSASTNLTPASTQQNLLSSLSAGHSLCLTPASSFEEPPSSDLVTNNAPTAAPARSVVDTFDLIKDANFYPLF